MFVFIILLLPLQYLLHLAPTVFSSSVPSSTPLSDFLLLGSSRTSESFPLFSILRSFSSLPLGPLNPFTLRRSVAHKLDISLPNINKLRDVAILVKAPLFPLPDFWPFELDVLPSSDVFPLW